MTKTVKAKEAENAGLEDVEDPSAIQHPALEGEPEAEVERRGADNTGRLDNRWRKVFVIAYVADFKANEDYINEVNKLAVYQEAIQNGLHPQGEATFDGYETQADGVSIALSYSVEVEPAVTDEVPADTVTTAEVLEDKFDGSTENAK